MQTALPLARSVSHAFAAPATRIPHLEYHIVRKLQRSKRASDPQVRTQQLRHRSTTADVNLSTIWPSATYDGAALDPNNIDSAPVPTSANKIGKSPSIDFNASLPPSQTSTRPSGFVDLSSVSHDVSASSLLAEGNPERLMTWLVSHPAGHAFVAAATNDEFDLAFCAIDPQVLADPFVRAQRHLGRATDVDWDLIFKRSLVQRLRSFANNIDAILVRRREYGAKLSIASCRHALKCAASVGDVRVADHIWDRIMAPEGIQPDIDCYNAYLHAHMWNLAHSEIARKSFRNTKRALLLRSQKQRPRNLLGYRTSTASPEPDWALRSRTLAIFHDITTKGLVTNEATFVNLILGLARSADLAGVNSILKSVWNIDVAALESYDEEELESPSFYPESHPLRPTANLLFAVVHAYAINNNVKGAWSLLDYISRNYALDIPDYVWDELFEWTYVLSTPRSNAQRNQGQSEGRVHMREVENLFNTLIDEPHNLEPSPVILNLLGRTYRKRRMLDKSLEVLRAAESDMVRRLGELRLMVDTIKAMLEDPEGNIANGMLSREFVLFRNDFQLAYLAVRQQYAFLITETRQILKEDDFAGVRKENSWSTRRLPAIVEEFEQYLPDNCEYVTKKGRVSLDATDHRNFAQDTGSIRPLLLEATAIWEALDTMDLFQMAGDLQNLSEKLKEFQTRPRSRQNLHIEDDSDAKLNISNV